MTDKRYNKRGMDRYRASGWEAVKLMIEGYAPQVYADFMAAFGCIGLVAVALFGAMLFA